MTTTELIKLLQSVEKGGISNRPRKIDIRIPTLGLLAEPDITVTETGDGICGPELSLLIDGGTLYKEKNDEDMIEPTWEVD